MYSYKISDFYMNAHFYFYQNNTLEERLYLFSHDMHELKINNGLYWTYISTLE